MQNCMQTESQNVLQHGESVWEFTKQIVSKKWDGLKIPDWLDKHYVEVINTMHPPSCVKNYTTYHDCGKPYCLVVGDDNKRHFPDHARISKKTYLRYFPDDHVTANLIGWDMVLHTATAEEINSIGWSKKDACTLLVVALAELHSNATMFGGINSTSFKIKWKKIDKRGRMLCKKFFSEIPHKYSYVVVRKDISESAQTVQSVHAAIESFKSEEYDHSSVIVVVVKNERKLQSVIEKLFDDDISLKVFREPDLNNEITAICTEPLIGERRDYLRKFQLL